MAKVYLTLILKGRKNYSQVPTGIKVEVKGLLQEMVNNQELSKTEFKHILAA